MIIHFQRDQFLRSGIDRQVSCRRVREQFDRRKQLVIESEAFIHKDRRCCRSGTTIAIRVRVGNRRSAQTSLIRVEMPEDNAVSGIITTSWRGHIERKWRVVDTHIIQRAERHRRV